MLFRSPTPKKKKKSLAKSVIILLQNPENAYTSIVEANTNAPFNTLIPSKELYDYDEECGIVELWIAAYMRELRVKGLSATSKTTPSPYFTFK